MGLPVAIATVVLITAFMGTPYAALSLIPILGCAERFTRKQRLRAISFVLFACFVVAWAVTCFSFALLVPSGSSFGDPQPANVITAVRGLLTSGATALGCALYFERYRFPVAYAAAAVALVNFGVHLLRIAAPDASAFAVSLVLLSAGLALFALAMRWDTFDSSEKSLRSDVAFWLHAAAGFQLAGACSRFVVGVTGDPTGWQRLYSFTLADFSTTTAATMLLLALLFAGVSLAINRPSLLTSSIAFALPALAFLIGGDEVGWLGSLVAEALFGWALSARWLTLRQFFLARLPMGLEAKLPSRAKI